MLCNMHISYCIWSAASAMHDSYKYNNIMILKLMKVDKKLYKLSKLQLRECSLRCHTIRSQYTIGIWFAYQALCVQEMLDI